VKNNAIPPLTFPTRIVWAFIGSIFIFAFSSFLSYHLERQLILRTNSMLQTAMAWVQLSENTERLEGALEKCIVAGDDGSFTAYEQLAEELYDSSWALISAPSVHRDVLASEGVHGMVTSLLEKAEEVLEAQKELSFRRSHELFREFGMVGELLRLRIHEAVMDLLRRENRTYQTLSEQLTLVTQGALLFMHIGLVLAFLLLSVFTYRLTRPLSELTAAAYRVSQGDFSQPVPVRGKDEVGYLARSFNRMADSLARLIQDLQKKSALEIRLKEQEVQNLSMQNMLQEERLQTLQAQINPHFFFNTLNNGVQLANLENADKTAAFFEKVGHMFRYNLRDSGMAVTLKEEIKYVHDYVDLLRLRFGEETFYLTSDVDPALLNTPVPRLILQPLVENAYQHGLAGTTGGRIIIKARRQEKSVLIAVTDNGHGITEDAIRQALHSCKNTGKSRRTGGLRNVIARLRLWSGDREPVEISGAPEQGTTVRLHIPYTVDQ